MKQIWLACACLLLTCESVRPVRVVRAESVKGSPPHPPQSTSAPEAAKAVEAPAPQLQGPLTTFFDALGQLEAGTRGDHVRILWLGDSHTNADFLSGTVRSVLSASYGDAGPGFVRIGLRNYRHDGLRLSHEGAWNVDPDPPARRARQGDGIFGLGGTRAIPGAKASYSLQVTRASGAGGEVSRFEVAYSLPPGSSFVVELSGRRLRVDEKTVTDVEPSGIAHLTLVAPLSSRLALTPGGGQPRLFGVVIERQGKPGLVLDTVGIDGARLATALAWNEAAFVGEVARRSPELLVIAFGTNEAFDALKVDRYGPQLVELVRRTRLGVPKASCLVLGPTDAPLGEGSVPRVGEVSEVLHQAAASLGCSFVGLQALMGGEGSFARGLRAKERLAQPDKLHLTPKGYQELGQALSRVLLDAYSKGRADLP